MKIILKTVVLKLQASASEDSNKTLFSCISIRNLMRGSAHERLHGASGRAKEGSGCTKMYTILLF